jgi:hypothetical protein
MSLALIQESAKEIRRLAIAGSPLAVGDFRLKKLIAPLEQAGAKVPVFAQVAKGLNDLVQGKEADSAGHLLSLSTLLNAILYTQGQTGAEGEAREIETFPTNCTTTKTSARALKPLVEALTTIGQGRFETVKEGIDRGRFNDLRLFGPALQALDDNYPELADLVAEKVLPAFGPGILPQLKAALDIKGKRADARRLQVMHQLDPAGALELCKTALEEGSVDVKVMAISCLGQHEDCLPLVQEQASAKNKVLREAALETLAGHDRPEITKLFSELIKGKALELLARPFRRISSREVLRSLLAEGKRVFDLLLKNDAAQLSRYGEILDCLEGRKDADTEAFLLGCFEPCDKLIKLKPAKNSTLSGADIACRLAGHLCQTGSVASLEAVLAKRALLPPDAFAHVLRGARRAWPADRVYQEFAPLLESKKTADKRKIEEIQRAIVVTCEGDEAEDEDWEEAPAAERPAEKPPWDPRWLDVAVKTERIEIVRWLARPGHKGAVAYLLKLAAAKNPSECDRIFQGLARCQHPALTDVLLDLAARKIKSARYLDYEIMSLFDCARQLPPADLPKLEAFAANLDEKFLGYFLQNLEPLRQAAPPAP